MDPTFHQFRIESVIPTAGTSNYTSAPLTDTGSSSSICFESGSRKALYGSGDADDGYTLVFESMAAFEAWRQKEEEEKMVEFVRNDRHVSKSVPPRFKEHTKLVCARHSKSGRTQYVKKFPDRTRKVPSRKLEGQGCFASISFKTYYDNEQVRVCYRSQHTHEIGPANLPFTRRGRKAQVEAQKARSEARRRSAVNKNGAQSGSQASSQPEDVAPSPSHDQQDESVIEQSLSAPSPAPAPPTPTAPVQPTASTSISQIAPLPQLYEPPSVSVNDSRERWERMGVLFESVRNHARTYNYPQPSVAALEGVLIRLYLESPLSAPAAGSQHMNVGT